jgi:hypothetical protein
MKPRARLAGQEMTKKNLLANRKMWVGEGATGIEPRTALKRGVQRHQTARDVRQATHVYTNSLQNKLHSKRALFWRINN